MLKQIVISIIALTVLSNSYGQGLKVGDPCPDILLKKFGLHNMGTIKLSQSRGKLIIIDLGAFNCSSCVEGALSLSNYNLGEFKGRIAPIFVITESKQRAMATWKANPNLRRITIPIVYSNQLIKKYFPYTYNPQEVWINSKGIVIAITTGSYLKRNYIAEALTKSTLDWEIKYDAFDPKEPIIQLNKSNMPYIKRLPKVINYSIFCGHLDGIEARQNLYGIKRSKSPMSDKKDSVIDAKVRVQFFNKPVVTIFKSLAGINFPRSRIIYAVSNIDDYDYNIDGPIKHDREWMLTHTFCYESTFPAKMDSNKIRQQVWANIEQGLNLKATIEKKNVECWVLKNLSIEKQEPSSFSRDSLFTFEKGSGYLRGYDLGSVAELVPGNPPVLIEESVDKNTKYIKISADYLTNFDSLKKAFTSIGLSLIKEKCDIEMLIIKENDYQSLSAEN
jgi:hypothetical protein